MKPTKKLTLSAILVAMGTVFMVLGAVIDLLDLTAAALSSLLVVFAYIEIGSPYTWLIWICTTVLSAVFYPGSIMWLTYFLIFGVYPILKGYIERLKRPLWLPIKLVYANLATVGALLISGFLLGIPLLEEGSRLASLHPASLYGVLMLMANIAFIAYDYFITVLVRYYYDKLRPRFKTLLK